MTHGLDGAWSDDDWKEDFEELTALGDLVPTTATGIGEHVWRNYLSDDERSVVRDVQARLVDLVDEDKVLQQREAILSGLCPAERAALKTFLVRAIEHTHQLLEFGERSIEKLEKRVETLER